jgi:hypothetical protein
VTRSRNCSLSTSCLGWRSDAAISSKGPTIAYARVFRNDTLKRDYHWAGSIAQTPFWGDRRARVRDADLSPAVWPYKIGEILRLPFQRRTTPEFIEEI